MTGRFREVISPELERIAEKGLTVRQVVTLASIVELETAHRRRAPPHRRGLPQPAPDGDAAADRPLGHLRAEAGRALGREHPQARPRHRLALQHLPPAGPAPGAARLPGPRGDPRRPRARRDEGALLREPQRRHPRVQRDPRRSTTAPWTATSGGARAPEPWASALTHRRRLPGPGPRVPASAATLVVVLVALALLLANGRPVGTPEASGAAGWLLRAATALASLALELDATGVALVGKALAALCAALAAGALFGAVVRRHGTGEGRWAGLLLALGTTLAAAAQAWSGEAAATCAVACAVLLLVRSEEEGEPGPAVAGRPAARPRRGAPALDDGPRARARPCRSRALAAGGPARARLGRPGRPGRARVPGRGARRRHGDPGRGCAARLPGEGCPRLRAGRARRARRARARAARARPPPLGPAGAGPAAAGRVRARRGGALHLARGRRGLGDRRLLGAAVGGSRLAARCSSSCPRASPC